MSEGVLSAIRGRLSGSDDDEFWAALLRVLCPQVTPAGALDLGRHELYLHIGACSHWLRPHQFRVAAAGGFAYPAGYGVATVGHAGLPRFDWSAIVRWDPTALVWVETKRFGSKRKLVCRVAAPTRTARHRQAVVHVQWSPGTPEAPNQKVTRYLAFRNIGEGWRLAAAGGLLPSAAA